MVLCSARSGPRYLCVVLCLSTIRLTVCGQTGWVRSFSCQGSHFSFSDLFLHFKMCRYAVIPSNSQSWRSSVPNKVGVNSGDVRLVCRGWSPLLSVISRDSSSTEGQREPLLYDCCLWTQVAFPRVGWVAPSLMTNSQEGGNG